MSRRRWSICILGDPKDMHVRRWSAGLASRGFEVCIICGRMPAQREARVAYRPLQIPGLHLRGPWRTSQRNRRYLRSLFREFDIIHLHHVHHWGIDEPAARCGRLVVSTYGRDVLPECLPGHEAECPIDHSENTAEMKKLAIRLADAVTSTSEFSAQATSRYAGIPREQIEVIHFGADLTHFATPNLARSETGLVGYCGGFRWYKGARVLIEAAPLVWTRFPTCRFSLYGFGGIRPELEALVNNRGHADRIHFHDFVPHRLPAQVVGGFDVYAFPSTNICEVYGVAGIEAQAMGVPVVASRIGGLPATVLDGQTGLLVEPASPEDLARGLCELLGDEPRRQTMGRAARRWVEQHHDWSKCLERMIAVYQRVMDSAPVSRPLVHQPVAS